MEKQQLKIWYAICSIIFLLLSILSVRSNFHNRYHIVFCIWSVIIYAIANIGNLFYSFSFYNTTVNKYWKIVLLFFIFHFVLAGIVDHMFGESLKEQTLTGLFINYIIGMLIFYPAFRANYRLSFINNTVEPMVK